MYMDIRVRFYYILSAILLMGGCFKPGGDWLYHHPPNEIVCDQPWTLTAKLLVNEKHVDLAEECKDFMIHIRDSRSDEYSEIRMMLISQNESPRFLEAELKAEMPLIPCNSKIDYVEYYMDHMTRGTTYNRSKLYTVPIRQ